MIYNHNIKINYIEFVEAEKVEEEIREDTKEFIDKLVTCRLVSTFEYFNNKKLIWLEKKKV